MEQWITGLVVGLLLLYNTWLDMIKRQVSIVSLLLFGVAGFSLFLYFQQFSILSLVGGIGIGILMILVSKLTNGGFGMGDGGLLCVTGFYLGFYRNIELFLGALVLAAVWGGVLLVLKKAGRKTELPFVPFLMTAYIGMLLR